MIELPRTYSIPVTSSNQSTQTIRFQTISDEEKPMIAVERRRIPSRRKPASRKQIERRVSSDRRRHMFNSKA